MNDVINAERLLAAAFGDVITLDQVPLVDTSAHSLVGRPLVPGASVTVRVAEQTQDAKRKRLARRRLPLCVLDGERVAHGGERGRDVRPPAARRAARARARAGNCVGTDGSAVVAAACAALRFVRTASAPSGRWRFFGSSVARRTCRRISWVNSQKNAQLTSQTGRHGK